MTPVTPQSPYVDTFFRELSPTWINHVAAFGGAAVVPQLAAEASHGTDSLGAAQAFGRVGDAHLRE